MTSDLLSGGQIHAQPSFRPVKEWMCCSANGRIITAGTIRDYLDKAPGR